LRARSLPMRAVAMASQASMTVRFLESENCISAGTQQRCAVVAVGMETLRSIDRDMQ
jgi:hypothetical protein